MIEIEKVHLELQLANPNRTWFPSRKKMAESEFRRDQPRFVYSRMPIIQEKCFGQNKQVKKFGQIANMERGWIKEPNRFKTFGGENDKENTHVKGSNEIIEKWVISHFQSVIELDWCLYSGCRKFGDKKHNEVHEIEKQKIIPIVYPTVDG